MIASFTRTRAQALQILALGTAAVTASCAPALPAPSSGPLSAPQSTPLQQPAWTTHLGEGHPLVGKIFDPHLGRVVTREEAEHRLRAASIVTIGEKHDNPDHHRVEAALLAVAADGRRGALVVEMVPTDKQGQIDAFEKTSPPASAEQLGPALDWDHSGWPPYAEYLPVFAVARKDALPIFAGDLPRAAAHDVVHRGLAAVDATDGPLASLSSRFALAAPLPPEAQARFQQEVADVHCGMLPAEMLPAMALAQRVRDASLAGAVLDAQSAAKAEVTVLVSGDGHARDDRAVPALLVKAGTPRAKILSVGILEVDDGWKNPADYAEGFHVATGALPFDLVWFTPRANEDDPCAKMKPAAPKR